MEKLSSLFGRRPATPFMEWCVLGHGEITERRIGPKREKTAQEAGAEPDGAFFVGDRIRLEIVPPFSGYFQLWNLGTSEKTKLLLDKYRVEGEFTIPARGQTLNVDEKSKTTAETGRNEIVVGIITREPVAILPEQMGEARSSISMRGFLSAEEVKPISLADLPDRDWAWCILETEIKR